MQNKLFGRTNINDLLFNIETQEGSDILGGDDGVASIGDATLEHVQGLNSLGRMAYDEYIHMGDGNIFRSVDNLDWHDRDEFNMKYNTKDERLLKLAKAPAALRDSIMEAMEALEVEEESEDVMNRSECLIGYDDWEKYGGMSKHWDIPSTPKPKMIFMGNSRAPFYDDFPEDHPLATILSRVLMTLGQFAWGDIINLETLADHNTEYPKKQIFDSGEGKSYMWTDGSKDYLLADEYVNSVQASCRMADASDEIKNHTSLILTELIMGIAAGRGEPSDLTVNALKAIDRFYFKTYKKEVVRKTKEMDPLYIFLAKAGKDAIEKARRGRNSYNEIKRIGENLFENGFVSEVLLVPGALCRRAKGKCLDGVTNREIKVCEGKEVGHALEGKKTIVIRPRRHHWDKYRSIKKELEMLRDRQKPATLSTDAINVVDLIVRTKEAAVRGRSLRDFTGLSTQLIASLKVGEINLTPREKEMVWAKYNNCKQEVTRSLSVRTAHE